MFSLSRVSHATADIVDLRFPHFAFGRGRVVPSPCCATNTYPKPACCKGSRPLPQPHEEQVCSNDLLGLLYVFAGPLPSSVAILPPLAGVLSPLYFDFGVHARSPFLEGNRGGLDPFCRSSATPFSSISARIIN